MSSSTYRVLIDGREVARYTEFSRAGRSGVRRRDLDGHAVEFSGAGAAGAAFDAAKRLINRYRQSEILVLRDDDTVWLECRPEPKALNDEPEPTFSRGLWLVRPE